ncbi:MAG: hypothetical protein P9L91_03350 [Candidatus Zophobacter franzmannii]|nr:hypothetical protein [Candidatus Zophobacter franzmannii]
MVVKERVGEGLARYMWQTIAVILFIGINIKENRHEFGLKPIFCSMVFIKPLTDNPFHRYIVNVVTSVEEGSSIIANLNGRLEMTGISTDQIEIYSNNEWDGIMFYEDGVGTFDYCSFIETPISADTAELEIDNSTFLDSPFEKIVNSVLDINTSSLNNSPIYASHPSTSPAHRVTLTDSHFIEVTANAVHLKNYPEYVITGNLFVSSGTGLYLEDWWFFRRCNYYCKE